MELLHAPPPGFDGVRRAYDMARHIPCSHQFGLKLGLVRDGVLFATAELHGYRQVKFLGEHLRSRGWQEHLLGDEAEMFGCDLLFSHPPDSQPGDPSFIRRPVAQLWPAQGASS